MRVAAVVTSDDAEVAHDGSRVLQQVDARILIELLGSRFAAEIFVVAQTGVDGCLQPSELLVHLLILERAHAHVDDVAGYEYHVWVLLVDHVHPSVQLVATVVVAYVQVAHHDQLDGFRHLLRLERQLLTVFVLVVHVAIYEQGNHEDQNTQNHPSVII